MLHSILLISTTIHSFQQQNDSFAYKINSNNFKSLSSWTISTIECWNDFYNEDLKIETNSKYRLNDDFNIKSYIH